jgi:bifunctional non-homologous end joining protein LigD
LAVHCEKIPAAYGSAEKLALYQELKAKGAEGVIFKRLDASYVPGRPESGGVLLKFKFYSAVTCTVIDVNAKRSVRLAVGQSGVGGNVGVGNVTIPPNHSIPEPGQIVDVRYLYAYPGGSLYQPTYLGIRTDKDVPDDLSILKWKCAFADSE